MNLLNLLSKTYLFVRGEGFYTLELGSDEEAVANAECNPGTVRVENCLGHIVWPPRNATKGESK